MTIVVATDFSPCSQTAARLAAALARRQHAGLVLVNIIEPLPIEPAALPMGGAWEGEVANAAKQALDGLAQEFRQQGLIVEVQVQFGLVAQAILDAAAAVKAGLIVVGTRGAGRMNPRSNCADPARDLARTPWHRRCCCSAVMQPSSPPPPASSSSFLAVRDDILEQHARLRGLLDQVDAQAQGVVRSDRGLASDLAAVLDGLLHELAAHMTFEEQALSAASSLPGTWDPSERARLGREHQRQREELARIEREGLHPDDPLSLAFAIRAFIADVRLDMSLEEDRLHRWSAPRP